MQTANQILDPLSLLNPAAAHVKKKYVVHPCWLELGVGVIREKLPGGKVRVTFPNERTQPRFGRPEPFAYSVVFPAEELVAITVTAPKPSARWRLVTPVIERPLVPDGWATVDTIEVTKADLRWGIGPVFGDPRPEGYVNILEETYPKKDHARWEPHYIHYEWKGLGAKFRLSAFPTIPDIHGQADLQALFKELFIESVAVLKEAQKTEEAYPFLPTRYRRDGLPQGSCVRCGSEYFNETYDLRCRDCGKWSASSKKGKLPFQEERKKLQALLKADDALNPNSGLEYSSLSGDILDVLLTPDSGFSEISTNKSRRARRLIPDWMGNSENVRFVLVRKFPLLVRGVNLRALNEVHRLFAPLDKIDLELWKEQCQQAGKMLRCFYLWSYCGMVDSDIAVELGLTTQQVEDLRTSFRRTGDSLFEPEPFPKYRFVPSIPRKGTIGSEVLDRMTFAEKLEYALRPLAEQRRWFLDLSVGKGVSGRMPTNPLYPSMNSEMGGLFEQHLQRNHLGQAMRAGSYRTLRFVR